MDEIDIDMPTLRALEDAMGNHFNMIISMYREVSVQYLNEIQVALHEAAYLKVSKAAHALKSSNMQMGAVRAGELAKMLEYSGKVEMPDRDVIVDLYQKLQYSQMATIDAIEQVYAVQ